MRAVEETAEWYRRYLAGADARAITLAQIAGYEGLQHAA
jgi:hypothetical protein